MSCHGWCLPGGGRSLHVQAAGVAPPSATLCHEHPGTPRGLRGTFPIYGMYNVLFHTILFAYLLASLLFWLYMGLQQRWIFYLAHALLGGGFGLQTLILGYNFSIRTFPLWGE